MVTEFSDILARNIIHICFGEDLADEILELKVKDENGTWVNKSVTIKDSIMVIVTQVMNNFYRNMASPINWLYAHTEVMINVSSDARVVKENCLQCRKWIKDYIEQRRSGKRKSDVAGGVDILTLMFERQDVWTDEFMVDELLGFFGAATETTHNVL